MFFKYRKYYNLQQHQKLLKYLTATMLLSSTKAIYNTSNILRARDWSKHVT